MAKIKFDSGTSNFVEVQYKEGKYILTLSAQNMNSPLTTMVNSVELTLDQLKELLPDLNLVVKQEK